MFKNSMTALMVLCFTSFGAYAADAVKIGLNYPETGPYALLGLDQMRAAKIAVEEINQAGGILGRKIELSIKDSKSEVNTTRRNVEKMIDEEGCSMVFGGSASSVAIAAGQVCKDKGKLFFGTLTYSNETTREEGHKYIFRECYDAWMGAKVLAKYLKEKFAGKTFYYVTADYTWGWTTEASIRQFSGTTDKKIHKRIHTPFPNATEEDFTMALNKVKEARPDVLVLVLFGKDTSTALKIAKSTGLKSAVQAIVVPNLAERMADEAGADVIEGVLGALPWAWSVPYLYKYDKGIKFVEKFASLHSAYPSTSAASAYTILYQYKEGVEKAGSFDTKPVITALEGHRFTSLKDPQQWREFDHQCIQTVYAVKCKPADQILKDRFRQDYFEIINTMSGEEAAITRDEWVHFRREAGKPDVLEW